MSDKPSHPVDDTKDDAAVADVEHQEGPTDEPTEPSVAPPEGPAVDKSPNRGKFRQLASWAKHHKKISIPLAVATLVAVVVAVPFSRYPVLGLFWKQSVSVLVTDKSSGKPVSSAQVMAQGRTVLTDKEGLARFSLPVGNKTITVSKKYYANASTRYLVPLRKPKQPLGIAMTATGRPVSVTFTNKVGGGAVVDAQVSVLGTEGKTDKDGKLTLVLPADKPTAQAIVKAVGFNDQTVTITVTEQVVKANTFQMVPAGKLYFLSKRSGKIDVVKTDMDGGSRQTILAGTGKEDDRDTVLLASRDWKYLALKSRRDGGTNAKLFLIETATDKPTTMDEGNADFTPNGWSDYRFLYTVQRNNVQYWQTKRAALKSYNAETKQIATLEETTADGGNENDYAASAIDGVYILSNQVVFNRNWNASYLNNQARLADKKIAIVSVKPDGSNKQTLKDFPASVGDYVSSALYKPQEIYFQLQHGTDSQFYELEDGKISEAKDLNQDSFSKPYPTFLLSPSSKQTFWYESRDGKNTLFLGDPMGDNAKQIASLSEYTPYGWYGDGYLLMSKQGSELYIAPASSTNLASSILKVTDYHKPSTDFRGYGYGYGGF
jgi:hypothetical protein